MSFTLKTPWSDGTTHLVLSPLELREARRSCSSASSEHCSLLWGVGAQCRKSGSYRARAREVPEDALTPSSPLRLDRSTATPGLACLHGFSVSMPGLSSPAFPVGRIEG